MNTVNNVGAAVAQNTQHNDAVAGVHVDAIGESVQRDHHDARKNRDGAYPMSA